MGRMAVAVSVGYHEARHWHRRIYGGQVNLTQVLPGDIGCAAAYEAYRFWKYHHPLYEPLVDRERQREAIMGMAIGEAQHLWQHTGRVYDNIGLREACESAAATASRIANRVLGYDGTIAQTGLPSSAYDQTIAYDAYGNTTSARPSALRRCSSYGSNLSASIGSPYINPAYATSSPYGGTASIVGASTPIPSMMGSYSAGAAPGAYITGVSSPSYAPGGVGSAYSGAAAYQTAATGGAYQVAPPMYAAGGVVPQAGATYMSGMNPVGYGAAGIAGYAAYPGQQTVPPGSTIIIRPRRHHHHHHHRSRSLSVDRY
ncbi:uncharacterized protein FIBRA_01869 [Fibroporia radiculosa]|uniref:Uncharacterized protein n=1 Tax=Fibroporia radiculosa TaxID=599839 RepID=J4GLM6_9APHY|nr:uncharacterized protein FIBRA_01869 [Fibroporia radiculosa]CCL99845.1 predicted protein [Fibroporia radiculosa]